jgi:hypothetical protein
MATTHRGTNSVLGKVEELVERGGIGEEKISFDEENPIFVVTPVGGLVEEKSVTEQEDSQFFELEELPDELESLRGQIFQNQDELLKAIDDLGFGDLSVILNDDGKAYLFMPGDKHDRAIALIAYNFTEWAANWKGRAADCCNIVINQTKPIVPMVPLPTHMFSRRRPDVSFWGDHKCKRSKRNKLLPKPASPPNGDYVNPDFVIQFSSTTPLSYETYALNDMMNRSESFGTDTPPCMGYLIKVRVGAGFDVYKVPQGTSVDDAKNNMNGAQHIVYNVGQADVVIKITPSDLGIPHEGIWNCMFYGNFEISLEELYEVACT